MPNPAGVWADAEGPTAQRSASANADSSIVFIVCEVPPNGEVSDAAQPHSLHRLFGFPVSENSKLSQAGARLGFRKQSQG
jgi:hypothetical protein